MMFGRPTAPAAAYAKVGLETNVQDASPYKLTLLLYEGAMTAVMNAKRLIEAHDIAGKVQAISRAIDIIEKGLLASLDMEAGGPIAEKLAAIYEFMLDRLVWANMKNDTAALDEVNALLKELYGAWVEIADQVTDK